MIQAHEFLLSSTLLRQSYLLWPVGPHLPSPHRSAGNTDAHLHIRRFYLGSGDRIQLCATSIFDLLNHLNTAPEHFIITTSSGGGVSH